MVYDGCNMDYAEQVTAEHKLNIKSGSRVIQRWVQKQTHNDTHYVDAEVYAMAAADILGVRTLHLEEKKAEEKPAAQEQYTPEEDWIHGNENWM